MDSIKQAHLDEEYIFYLHLVLQKNLMIILKIMDVSVEKFASYFGLTAQTIRNLCSFDTLISTTQFLSIMSFLEMERREGENKEALNLFMNTLLDVDSYKKYSGSFQTYYENNIENQKRKLSKKNSAAGLTAILTAFGAGAAVLSFLNPLSMTGVLASTALTGAFAASKVRQTSRDRELQTDLKKLEQSDLMESFSWMKRFYNVRATLHSNTYYSSFISALKQSSSNEQVFDQYINLMLEDLGAA